ncbi:MAG: hypothetical protein J6S67_11135 [Methanobrevibacter sp.]|nr:hypothetical protein [Methanobrevibacter sp.]
MKRVAKGFWEAQPIKQRFVQLELFEYHNDTPIVHNFFIDTEDSRCLLNLKEKCRELVIRKFNKRVECEEQHDYLQFIEDEATLEFCDQLRKIADNLERKVLEK